MKYSVLVILFFLVITIITGLCAYKIKFANATDQLCIIGISAITGIATLGMIKDNYANSQ
jgi:hypothetical protein